MTILKDCQLWFVKANPKFPNDKFNKKNPTWECQIRTEDKDQKKQWEDLKLGVKAIVPDEGPTYWRVNLRKKSIKEDGSPSSSVATVSGKMVEGKLEEINPDSIGNGSIGNVRIFQYEYDKETGGKGVATVLMGIQVTKHIVYKPKPRDDSFGETETETVDPRGTPEEEVPDDDDVKY
jgi:hypothetical protein